jgi:hypothetical protein
MLQARNSQRDGEVNLGRRCEAGGPQWAKTDNVAHIPSNPIESLIPRVFIGDSTEYAKITHSGRARHGRSNED